MEIIKSSLWDKRDLLLISVGIAGLIVGALVYIIDRSPDQTYFIYRFFPEASLYRTFPNLFGSIGNYLPEFVHVFSFILITASIIQSECKNAYIIISVSWVFIDCIFEFGQKFNHIPARTIPDWFNNIPFLENSAEYFYTGTFDVFDLIAIILGGTSAYLFLEFRKRREKHGKIKETHF